MKTKPYDGVELDCITGDQVAALIKFSRRTLSRKVAMKEFPAPVRIGKGIVRWRMRDVRAYLDRCRGK